MGQILHGYATMTAVLRRAIQHSQESLKQIASHYHINIKTVAKWRKRTTVKDAPMGPRRPHSTVLTMDQEAAIVAFRRQTLLSHGRLFVCVAGNHSEFDSFRTSSLFAATQHQPFAGCWR